jgi:hypothetical protein
LTGHEKYATKGLLALTAADNGQQEVQTLIARIDDITAVVDPSVKDPKAVYELEDMDALIEELRATVQKMQDDCDIVVQLPADELTLPEDLDAVPESGLPDLPLGPPGAEGMPEAKPEDQPAPGQPGEEQPPVGEPVEPEMPVDADEPVDPSELMEPEVPEMPAEPPEAPPEPGVD